MAKKFNMTIGGESYEADQYSEIYNPADTDEIVGLAPVATQTQLDHAFEAARDAFPSWSRTADKTRADACRTIAAVVTDNAEELAALVTAEQGKPFEGFGSRFELQGCAGWAAYCAETSLERKVLEDSEQNKIELLREPLGVVASITPWNWPLILCIAHIVPGIRTGNTIVTKPSPYTPLSTLRMIELIAEALPPGVVNVVSGGDELGAMMTAHDQVDKIVFTGSIPTGKKVMSSASQHVTPLTLELGGNDAGILLPGTDPTPFAERMFWGAMINAGQTCGALKRLYVHEDDYVATCEALVGFAANIRVGNGRDDGTMIGPIQNKAQFDKVSGLVEDAKAHAATILCGGEPVGGANYLYPITLVGDIADGVRLVDEEQFGPVLPIIRYTDLDQAIFAANNTEFGLDASVWGTDEDALRNVAGQLQAGTIFINKHAEIAPHVPMVGTKCSGLGVAFGQEGLESYTSIKVINMAV